MRTKKCRLFASLTVPLCLVFAASSAAEEPKLVLPEGTEIPLELLHHLNSSYSSPGSEVFLAVAEDVIVDGHTVIPRGLLVRGFVSEAEQSKNMGRAGHLQFHVDSVVTPDGTEIPLDADFGAHGRDRAKATGHLTAAFGFAGMFAKGRMAYLEKGTGFTAVVSEDREVGLPAWSEGAGELRAADREGEASLRDDSITLTIDKGRSLSPIKVSIESPQPRELTPEELERFALVAIDEFKLPEPVKCLVADGASLDVDGDGLPEHELRCEAWDVLKYCDEGQSSLVFQGPLDDGSIASARAGLKLHIRKK